MTGRHHSWGLNLPGTQLFNRFNDITNGHVCKVTELNNSLNSDKNVFTAISIKEWKKLPRISKFEIAQSTYIVHRAYAKERT